MTDDETIELALMQASSIVALNGGTASRAQLMTLAHAVVALSKRQHALRLSVIGACEIANIWIGNDGPGLNDRDYKADLIRVSTILTNPYGYSCECIEEFLPLLHNGLCPNCRGDVSKRGEL